MSGRGALTTKTMSVMRDGRWVGDLEIEVGEADLSFIRSGTEARDFEELADLIALGAQDAALILLHEMAPSVVRPPHATKRLVAARASFPVPRVS